MSNTKNKVLFICSFSSQKVRERLRLKTWRIRNALFKIINHPNNTYYDRAIWVEDYIMEFEKHTEFEFHILATHKGLTCRLQEFDINGLHYHFVKSDHCLLGDILNGKYHYDERSDYRHNRRVLLRIIDRLNPDIVLVCGAENPEYSSVVLDINNRPVYLILQTVLNNPKLAQYTNEAHGYRAKLEKRIFKKVHYFGTSGMNYCSLFHGINPKALCLPVRFPSHKPSVFSNIKKEYDFVFFGRMTKNKGIEDAIIAMNKLVYYHPEATLCVIGTEPLKSSDWLYGLVMKNELQKNIVFVPRFELLEDLYAEVQKARYVLLPGITAFNSTVRESMMMGMPTIVYELPKVKTINADKACLLSAKMEDVDDLCEKMRFAMENPKEMSLIATNGREYAENNYNNTEIGDKIADNIRAIISDYRDGVQIPSNLLFSNHE